MAEEMSFAEQAAVLDKIADEKRLRILEYAVDGPVAAPDLAEKDEFAISGESILYHLNILESAGFLESKSVQGPYKRPRKEFELAGNGRTLTLEIVKDGDYEFSLREPALPQD
ncbi:ArsR/SmtB family transcription factor [Natronolimnobius baerhuensis]|uniref:Transcriptional regulator n=1 Tax=Natronolimnobius baerhuensis TaxID=253108 RepID=A0A202E581_9EURY|nr:helix-turn-helix domain-containing protein [Natronolimnobius baerhuensis]OVE83415.1 transcriptional regulator [Natronolimnobius baerhuensis]